MSIKKQKFQFDEKDEHVQYYLKKVEDVLNITGPYFQKFVLELALKRLPPKMKECDTEERHDKAVNEVFNIYADWPTEKIRELAKDLRKRQSVLRKTA